MYRGWRYYKRNELDLANEEFSIVVDQRYRIHNRPAIGGYCGLALTHQALGRSQKARDVIEEALAFDLELGFTGTRALIEANQAQLALMQGDLETASRWAAAFDRRSLMIFMTFYAGPHLMLPRILIAQNTAESLDEATRLISEMLAIAEGLCNALDGV